MFSPYSNIYSNTHCIYGFPQWLWWQSQSYVSSHEFTSDNNMFIWFSYAKWHHFALCAKEDSIITAFRQKESVVPVERELRRSSTITLYSVHSTHRHITHAYSHDHTHTWCVPQRIPHHHLLRDTFGMEIGPSTTAIRDWTNLMGENDLDLSKRFALLVANIYLLCFNTSLKCKYRQLLNETWAADST